MDYRSFYLQKRKLPSGTVMYYVYYRTETGMRTVPHSTGKTTKNSAWLYCASLMKDGRTQKIKRTFGAFAQDFFSESGAWYRDACLSGGCARSTLCCYQSSLKNAVLPYFSEMLLSQVSAYDIRNWRLWLTDRGLSLSSINTAQKVLRRIFDWASDCGYVSHNPLESVKSMRGPSRKKESFSVEETSRIALLCSDRPLVRLFVLTAACTGLRVGELLGLRVDDLQKNPFPHIEVSRQWGRFGVGPTKNRRTRFVPLPDDLYTLLCAVNTEYVFASTEKRTSPYSATFFTKQIRDAYRTFLPQERIGCVTVHSFRHFFNTFLISHNVSDRKLKAVMGHSSGASDMTDVYTTWNIEMFAEIHAVQNILFARVTK